MQLKAMLLSRADERTYVLTPENSSVIRRYGTAEPSVVDGMFGWVVDLQRTTFMIRIRPFEVTEESKHYLVALGQRHAVLELVKSPPQPPIAFIVESNSQCSTEREMLESLAVEAFRIGGEFCLSDLTGYFSDLRIGRLR